jgi:hypothetical protein
MYLSPTEYVPAYKTSTYKYEAHWNEHIKAFNCEDPPIPKDIYIYIRLAVCEWMLENGQPQTKKDIKKILISLKIPKQITEKYTLNRPFNLQRRYYERWRTILYEMGFCKTRTFMNADIRRHLREMFQTFIIAFITLRKEINRKSLFHFDFLIYHFLIHLKNKQLITFDDFLDNIIWVPLHQPINKKTFQEFKYICNKCEFIID